MNRLKTWLIIFSGFAFTIGNAIWINFSEPKIMYIPLSLFIAAMLIYIKGTLRKEDRVINALIDFFCVLSFGYIIKQVTYKPGNQWMDYVWGGLVLIWLIYEIWAIRKHRGAI